MFCAEVNNFLPQFLLMPPLSAILMAQEPLQEDMRLKFSCKEIWTTHNKVAISRQKTHFHFLCAPYFQLSCILTSPHQQEEFFCALEVSAKILRSITGNKKEKTPSKQVFRRISDGFAWYHEKEEEPASVTLNYRSDEQRRETIGAHAQVSFSHLASQKLCLPKRFSSNLE